MDFCPQCAVRTQRAASLQKIVFLLLIVSIGILFWNVYGDQIDVDGGLDRLSDFIPERLSPP